MAHQLFISRNIKIPISVKGNYYDSFESFLTSTNNFLGAACLLSLKLLREKNRSTYVFNYILCIVNMIGDTWKKSCSRAVERSENLGGPSNNSRPFKGEGFDYIRVKIWGGGQGNWPPSQCVELKLRWRFCVHTIKCPEIYL